MKSFTSLYFKKDILEATDILVKKFNLDIKILDESSIYASNKRSGIWFYFEATSIQHFFVDVATDKKIHFHSMFLQKGILDKYPKYDQDIECRAKFKVRSNYNVEQFYYEEICFAKQLCEIISKYFELELRELAESN